MILARTRKGRGFSEVEDREGWHGRPLPAEMAERAIIELGGERHLTVSGPRPEDGSPRVRPSGEVSLPRYELGAKVATRLAFGQALAAVGARSDVVALDGEVGNSTHAEEFAKAYPERYFEMFIAEQQLVAAAVGMSVRGYVPFAATFAAFFTRAYDFIRMSAISEANIRLCGSHAGVEIGADGPSQMALEDLAMMRAVHGSTVLYPSDATSTACLVQEMADREGIVYMRTTRGAYPVLYRPDEAFPIGGAKVLRSSPDDQVTLIGAGVTLHNCLAAADELGRDGITPGSWTCTRSSRSTPRRCSRRRPRRAAGWWSSRTTTRRAVIGGAVLEALQRRGPPRPASPTWRSAACPAPGPPPSSWRPPGSQPTTSSRPPARSSAPDPIAEPRRRRAMSPRSPVACPWHRACRR